MIKRFAIILSAAVIGLLSTVSCHRQDTQTTTVHIPEMSTARDVRIVTNAALNEVVGVYTPRNRCKVDLVKKRIIYSESPRLRTPDYLNRITFCIAEVGFPGKILRVQEDPPIVKDDKIIAGWVGRHTAVISVPDMKTIQDANIVVDAIAYARIGGDHPSVSVDASARTLTATYPCIVTAEKNIEHAIACTGYRANLIPARLAQKDSVPQGWLPRSL